MTRLLTCIPLQLVALGSAWIGTPLTCVIAGMLSILVLVIALWPKSEAPVVLM